MIELSAWACRFMFLAGALFAAGHVIVGLLHGVRLPVLVPVLLAVFGAVGGFMVQASALTGTLSGAFDTAMLALLWSTAQGTALAWHLSGLALIGVGAFFKTRWVPLVGVLTLLIGFLAVGHVADTPGIVLGAVLAVHVLCGAYWAGVLWPLYHLAHVEPRTAAHLGDAFGRFAIVAVPVLLALGLVMAVTLLDRVDQLWTTAYGWALVGKVAAVLAMLVLGAANKLRHVPALLAGRPGAASGLRRSLLLECGFALIVLGATAAFSTLAGLS